MVCFVAVLIPHRTIEAVGYLDERYTDYGCDDDDYSFMVTRNGGLKLGIHDGCYVDHSQLTPSFRGAPGNARGFVPNLKLFIQKWGTDNWGRDRTQSPVPGLFPDSVVGVKA